MAHFLYIISEYTFFYYFFPSTRSVAIFHLAPALLLKVGLFITTASQYQNCHDLQGPDDTMWRWRIWMWPGGMGWRGSTAIPHPFYPLVWEVWLLSWPAPRKKCFCILTTFVVPTSCFARSFFHFYDFRCPRPLKASSLARFFFSFIFTTFIRVLYGGEVYFLFHSRCPAPFAFCRFIFYLCCLLPRILCEDASLLYII